MGTVTEDMDTRLSHVGRVIVVRVIVVRVVYDAGVCLRKEASALRYPSHSFSCIIVTASHSELSRREASVEVICLDT